ncbi:MAG TPA: RNA repair transcriptional activator RtcR [Labilithrix sp.]|nr:RNA repair transcriptional activator RtcR [Labilithrix sp.]
MAARRKLVVLGLLGPTLDEGRGARRWDRWRPTVALAQHEDLVVDRLELLHGARHRALADVVTADIEHASPETTVVRHDVDFADPWDFESVYGVLHDFARSYPFDESREDYLVHITTGTHVAQICLFLLTESRHLPGRLLQTSPGKRSDGGLRPGTYAIIDLDLSRYDRLASRFGREHADGRSFLKAGIDTKNVAFNALIERIEKVASVSRAPVLLTGPTGAGKTELARRIFELKKSRRQVKGAFAEVNCATLRGDAAMSALFGHVKGAFTGATTDRAGLLRRADGGVVFLDEIGELGSDEQAMLLRAIEDGVFTPMGADREVKSDFQLICGTNRDLAASVAAGRFREDLLARIHLWTFRLPSLAERLEDLAPNLDFEIARTAQATSVNVTMSREARERFLRFGRAWAWPGNFRDLNAAVTRMATFAVGGRITVDVVNEEIARLGGAGAAKPGDPLVAVLGAERAALLDRFDAVQLADVLAVCAGARSLSEAGRVLFARSRATKASANDADRLRKYLARYELAFADLPSR